MFPDQKFSRQGGNSVVSGKGERYYIECIVFGNFTSKQTEFLIIVRRPVEVISHAEGFYSAYVGVFDATTHKLLTPVKHFTGDEGSTGLFKGKEHTYLFFAGNVTFQGWTDWNGGLYRITRNEWKLVWPSEENFWENKAIQIGQDRVVIYKRKITDTENSGIIPPYTFVIEQELLWDSQKEEFALQASTK